MAEDLLKLKQIRNGHRTHATKLMGKASKDLQEKMVIQSSLVKKQEILEKYDNDILMLITDEAEVAAEIENTSEFTDKIISATTKLQLEIEEINKKNVDVKPSLLAASEVKTEVKSDTQVKLPKITIPVYDGSLLKWSCFWSQFHVAVHSNPSLSDIQKFTYLKSYLSGEAERSIRSLSLVDVNYKTSIDILHSRF